MKETAWLVYNGGLFTHKFQDYASLMQRAARLRGVELTTVANDELLVTTDGVTPCRSDLAEPAFIHFADKDLPLANALEREGYRLYNRARTIELCDDKRLMHQAFAGYGVPQPLTITAPMAYPKLGYRNTAFCRQAASLLGFPLVVKEAFGSFGEQVYWVETMTELEDLVERLAGVPHLYQKAVTESFGSDIRINIVGSSPVAAMKRKAEGFRANVTAGGTTEPYEPSQEEINVAVAAARAVGADMAGVDLFTGSEQPLVCEINSNPHVRSIIECTGVPVHHTMIEKMLQGRTRI
ncbi:RimK family alpha-L-glutamate ligase [Bacillus daqingensis]|uniref:RimK family alpha-L-glutamate ligase n=1 Tax=Bacillus daqingensis TaxID=872396 RepID=A0ABV9NX45_9BACI